MSSGAVVGAGGRYGLIYSLARVATLVLVLLNIYTIDATTPVNCQLLMSFQFTLAYLALAASSLLIVLRVIAIWERNKIIIAIATGIWGTNNIFLVQGVLRFHTTFGDANCQVHDVQSIKLSTTFALITDIVLFSIMLIGLARLRRHGMMALGRLLWNQGVIWVLVAVVAELTPTVFIYLDLNDPFNVLFQIPWVITMSIAATRMYRALSDFLSSSSNMSQGILPTSNRTALETNRSATGQYAKLQENRRSVPDMDENSFGKPPGLIGGTVCERCGERRDLSSTGATA